MPAKGRPQRAGPSIFLASAAVCLRVGRSALCWQPDASEPAALPSVGVRVTVSRPVFLASADGVAARRLAVAVCAPDKLSPRKRTCD
jgi:hypothetical protein